MTTKRTFTEDEKIAIRNMRDAFNMSWSDIGKRFRAGHKTVRAAVDPEFAKIYVRERAIENGIARKRRADAEDYYGVRKKGDVPCSGPSIPDFVERDRVERLNAPYRSLGDAILGCPPKGYSALDRRSA